MRSAWVCAAVFLSVIGGYGGKAARAAIVTLSFDTDADVALSSSPSTTAWSPDRYRPQVFAGGMTAPDDREGTLLEIIAASDSLKNRPVPYKNDAFYNTQGRSLELPANANGLLIDLYVPHVWDYLSQTQGRLASFWATGLSATNSISAYPIIEFNNNVDGGSANGFRIWDSFAGVWKVVPGFQGYDQWYQIGFMLSGGVEEYFVNGQLVGTINDTTTTSFENVILQGYNAGTSYDIYWDNLQIDPPNPLPEPSTLAIFSLGGASLLIAGRFRRKSAASMSCADEKC